MEDAALLFNISPFIAYITKQPGILLWIWDESCSRLLYLSDNCENILMLNKETLLEQPEAFYNLLHEEDKLNFKNNRKALIQKQCDKFQEITHIFFRVKPFENTILYIYEFGFVLKKSSQEVLGYCGVCNIVSEKEWQLRQDNLAQASFNLSSSQIFTAASNSVQNKAHRSQYIVKTQMQKDFSVTQREAQCLYYLLQGCANKKIASNLKISRRTVESYFFKLYRVFQVNSKIKLIAQIINIKEILTWQFND